MVLSKGRSRWKVKVDWLFGLRCLTMALAGDQGESTTMTAALVTPKHNTHSTTHNSTHSRNPIENTMKGPFALGGQGGTTTTTQGGIKVPGRILSVHSSHA